MIPVLGRAGTPPAGTCLHLALPAGAGHALPALLAGETADRVAASKVPGTENHRHDREDHHEHARHGKGTQDPIEHFPTMSL
ncbi:MAG: hypothetical protein JWQ56_2368 [Pseudarthrobacter sp.]|nr:hypothetical protein [Pseudarthrobacter sp.]